MLSVRVAAAQTPEIRENVDEAVGCLVDFTERAEAAGASLLCFPEGFLQGYLLNEEAARHHALDLASPAFSAVLNRFPKSGPTLVVGLIEIERGCLYNTAIVVERSVLVGRYRKTHLLRGEAIFAPGAERPVFEAGGLRFGINICNDMNFPEAARKVADCGGRMIVCPANNMLARKTAEAWKDLHNVVRGERCRETGLWLLSADVTGERDGRISWGPTAVLDPAGQVAMQLPLEAPGLLVFDVPLDRPAR